MGLRQKSVSDIVSGQNSLDTWIAKPLGTSTSCFKCDTVVAVNITRWGKNTSSGSKVLKTGDIASTRVLIGYWSSSVMQRNQVEKNYVVQC